MTESVASEADGRSVATKAARCASSSVGTVVSQQLPQEQQQAAAPLVVQGVGDCACKAAATLVPVSREDALNSPTDPGCDKIERVACVRDAANPIVDMLALAHDQHAAAFDALDY